MNCRVARQLISPYLDHQLTGREMLELQEHFSRCVSCADEMHSILQVKQLLRGLHAPATKRDLSDTISVRLKEAEAGANGWRVLSLPPTRGFSALSFTSLSLSSSLSIPAARPPRGRRLATALGLSCLTVLSMAAPFAPASRDGARMTSGFLSSAFLMSPMTSPDIANSEIIDPSLLNQTSLSQTSAQSMPVGVIDQPILTAAPAMPQNDLLTLTADQFPSQRRGSVFFAQASRSNAVSPANYLR